MNSFLVILCSIQERLYQNINCRCGVAPFAALLFMKIRYFKKPPEPGFRRAPCLVSPAPGPVDRWEVVVDLERMNPLHSFWHFMSFFCRVTTRPTSKDGQHVCTSSSCAKRKPKYHVCECRHLGARLFEVVIGTIEFLLDHNQGSGVNLDTLRLFYRIKQLIKQHWQVD